MYFHSELKCVGFRDGKMEPAKETFLAPSKRFFVLHCYHALMTSKYGKHIVLQVSNATGVVMTAVKYCSALDWV